MRPERWAPFAGIAFAALFLIALGLTSKGPCGNVCFARTTDREVIAI